MPGLEKRLARYPQLYSRVGFAHHFRSLSKAEVYYLIEHHCKQLGANFGYDDLADTEVLAAIVRITNGNFRLINRLLKQVNRIPANQSSLLYQSGGDRGSERVLGYWRSINGAK
jgi:hypothetical protein